MGRFMGVVMATRGWDDDEMGVESGPIEVGKPVKRAWITGITGQDGLHLAELLLSKG